MRLFIRLLLLSTLGVVACSNTAEQQFRQQQTGTLGASASIKDLMKARQLSEADVQAALETYLPSGRKDDYVIFASGGQSGQVLVIGVPSMRILKVIAVFTPEPWQGYGYGDGSDAIVQSSTQMGHKLTWADTHHPALSETKGDYDGDFLFVNDKANARIAVIDLKDFSTKQIVSDPILMSNHGATFVTPNTDYIIEGSQYAAPLGREYEPLSNYKDKYRGFVMFWKFDRQAGRVDPSKSFGLELPPYTQDLADAGKLASDGWAFINSLNTEMATGGDLDGKPPMESGASQNDMDYMHVINWRKAEQLVADGKAVTIAGVKVLPMSVTGPAGVLTLVGESKSRNLSTRVRQRSRLLYEGSAAVAGVSASRRGVFAAA